MHKARIFFLASTIYCSHSFASDLPVPSMERNDILEIKHNNRLLIQRNQMIMQRREEIETAQLKQNKLLINKIFELEEKIAKQDQLIKTYDLLVTQLKKELEAAKNGGK